MTTQLIIKEHKVLPNGQRTAVVHILEKGKYISKVFTTKDFKSVAKIGHGFIIEYLCERIEGYAKSRLKAYEVKYKATEKHLFAVRRILEMTSNKNNLTYVQFNVSR